MARTSTVSVLERPDGIFVATCSSMPGLQAEGSTAFEAEQNLEDLLRTRFEQKGSDVSLAPAEDDELPEEE